MTDIDDSMIKRVAEAIAYAASLGSDSGTPPKWSDWRDEARAAIAAMREPSARMLRHGEQVVDAYIPGQAVDLIWKAMIDEALVEDG